MIDGIAGVMNLAAASGEDLGSTSDIVTDAITAFGMQAGDATHFADVLAQASANANTNVGMLGESFKCVAPDSRSHEIQRRRHLSCPWVDGECFYQRQYGRYSIENVYCKYGKPDGKYGGSYG